MLLLLLLLVVVVVVVVQVVFYDTNGREQQVFDYSTDPEARDFSCCSFSPSGDVAVVGAFSRFYVYRLNSAKGTWEEAGMQQVRTPAAGMHGHCFEGHGLVVQWPDLYQSFRVGCGMTCCHGMQSQSQPTKAAYKLHMCVFLQQQRIPHAQACHRHAAYPMSTARLVDSGGWWYTLKRVAGGGSSVTVDSTHHDFLISLVSPSNTTLTSSLLTTEYACRRWRGSTPCPACPGSRMAPRWSLEG
jgi:hypothetical protein